jgi:hypothetical protein
VYIDGVMHKRVNAYTPNAPEPQQAIYSITGLGSGPHVLTIDVVGVSLSGPRDNTNVVVDAFDVGSVSPALVQESDASVSYTGTWMQLNDPSVSGGSILASNEQGASAKVYFYGTGIAWIGYRCPCSAGIASLTHISNGRAEFVGQRHTYAPDHIAQSEIYRLDGLPLGPHVLEITVTGDTVGTNDWIAVDAFRVLNGTTGGGPADTTPPTVSITEPESDALVTGMVTITAAATDNVGVMKVQFFAGIGGPLLGEDSTPPYALTGDTSNVPSGSSFTLVARAIDAAGNLANSIGTPVTVQHSDRVRPTVTITSPAAGSTVAGTINLTANATDNQGIKYARFNIDGLGLDYYPNPPVANPPYTMPLNTTLLTDGTHVIHAYAVDTADNMGIAAPVTVTVDNSVQPGMRRVDDDDPAVTFAGTWTHRTSNLQFHWGGAAESTTAGATATFTFQGTGVRWLSLTCAECGNATVSLDGGPPQLIDLYGGLSVGSVEHRVRPVYTSPVLANGSHTLTITVGAGSTGRTLVFVDGFEVLTN